MLTGENAKTNTQAGIVKQFDEIFIASEKINLSQSFHDIVFQIKENEPTEEFAKKYLEQAVAFLKTIDAFRTNDLSNV